MLAQVKKTSLSLLMKQIVHFLEHDPEKNFDRLLRAANVIVRHTGSLYLNSLQSFEEIWHDKNNPWHPYFTRYLTWLAPRQRVRFATNFLANASVLGYTKQLGEAEKLGCNIPWAILMDPTSACNLKCIGCWAAEYKKQDNLTFEEMDSVIRQGKEFGTYFYIFSGGEPLMRKKDLIRLCDKHPDCFFAAFTNGTLIDEAFAGELRRVGNFVPILSIEGIGEATDMRRGEGTFQKVVRAMDILRGAHLAFGFSCCYTSRNIDSVASDEFIDFMIEKGAWFGWYFTFIPVGTNAPVELIATPEQRAYMYRRVNEIRSKRPIFVLDFWNDGQYSNGCVAGGRRYFHINAAGDAEPCAFIHYADSNIRTKSIAEILKSPLFMAYRRGQPFNSNLLRPCPLLDNPEKLRRMVQESGAHSTQPLDPEDVTELTEKCVAPAERWAPTADKIWCEEICTNPKHAAYIRRYRKDGGCGDGNGEDGEGACTCCAAGCGKTTTRS